MMNTVEENRWTKRAVGSSMRPNFVISSKARNLSPLAGELRKNRSRKISFFRRNDKARASRVRTWLRRRSLETLT